jgi:hypothetical protein
MTSRGSEELQQQLDSLRAQQARVAASGQGDGAQARALARDIAAIAAQLGLDADEAAALAGQVDAPAGPGHPMAGEYKVLRGSAEPILSAFMIAMGAAVIGLGQPTAGAGLIIAALTMWILRSVRRVARLRIDASGALSLPGHIERIEPSELVGVDFAYRYPPGIPEHKKAANETIELRLRLPRDRVIELARGPLWRTRPRREPIAYAQLERHLLALARDAGLKVERGGGGWTARR